MMKSLKLLFIAAGVLLLIAISAIGYAFTQLKPADTTATETTSFVIPKGQAVQVIASRLEEDGLIRNALAFRVLAKLEGFESSIQSGSFKLSPSMTPSEIGEMLTSGSEDIWVTIPEGWRAEEIATSLAEQELPLFDEEEFLALARSDEGRLFPDSYLVPKEFTAEQIHSLLINTFETKVVEGLSDEIDAAPLPLDEAIVLASIIERESRGADEMRQVAGILYNRLDIGMALQTDATLQYIEGYDRVEQSWWTPPSVATKQIDSPYNTYLYPDLPPRPIANPGIDAIAAALSPAENDYLFYIHDRQGGIHYATTLDEHNRNIDRHLR